MNRDSRLRRKSDFDAVYKNSRAHGDRLLMVRVRESGADPSRFGFVTTKAVGGAVVRNRVKRRLRAAASALDIMQGLDIVVSARKPAAAENYEPLARSLRSLLDRAGALRK